MVKNIDIIAASYDMSWRCCDTIYATNDRHVLSHAARPGLSCDGLIFKSKREMVLAPPTSPDEVP
jgi:hypothetical protein